MTSEPQVPCSFEWCLLKRAMCRALTPGVKSYQQGHQQDHQQGRLYTSRVIPLGSSVALIGCQHHHDRDRAQ